MISHKDFFKVTVPNAVNQIQSETKPEWGCMNAQEMLAHLIAGMQMCYDGTDVFILTPEEKLGAAKAFLMSDKPMPKNFPKPDIFNSKNGSSPNEINELKLKFIDVLETFLAASLQAEFTCKHPQFGQLNGEEARQLQFKHISHHFTQFNLI
jgi:hypothetical protein